MYKFAVITALAALTVFAPWASAQAPGAENGTKSVTEELQEMEKRSAERLPAELVEAGKKAEIEIRDSGILDSALNVGAAMPVFSLKDEFDKDVSSNDLLKKGHIVLVFYRGAWCPYCNLYLRGLQRSLGEFRERGAQLVAISVEPADRSLKVVKDNKLEYTVLSDPGLATARKFGIVYTLPEALDSAAKQRGFDIGKYNGTEKSELPVSATYVVSKEGKIEFAFLDVDYKKRAAPADIIEVLDRINGAKD
ncbi:MAG TPA: peroxiredoxin-like family protein [Aridibacter sp.]|nr:peroxiredoxin-like family protein [Aridibacter sp.]